MAALDIYLSLTPQLTVMYVPLKVWHPTDQDGVAKLSHKYFHVATGRGTIIHFRLCHFLH